MSDVERTPVENTLGSGSVGLVTPGSIVEPADELLLPREVPLGGPRAMLVRRTLPNRVRRMVGAWCFVDYYGPADITGQAGMQVPPHPHTGLQTVSWLLRGEVLHRDSLGSTQLIRPGELSLMTAGHGISHAEESPAEHGAVLHGVQLWVALPAAHRDRPAEFAHHSDLPVVREPGGTITVIMGELAGARSAARTFSPLVGAELAVAAGRELTVPLDPGFEHAVLALSADSTVDGSPTPVGALRYLGGGRRAVRIASERPVRALLLGGAPFEEQLVMWWNLVGRSHEEIVQARSQWEAERAAADPHGRFGSVSGYAGPPLAAPALPNAELRARGREGRPPLR